MNFDGYRSFRPIGLISLNSKNLWNRELLDLVYSTKKFNQVCDIR